MSQFEAKLLEKKIREMESLPIPSLNASLIVRLIRSGADTRLLVDCLELSPVLLAQCLFAIYRSSEEYRNIFEPADVIDVLGADQLMEIICSLPHFDNFDPRAAQEWEHSFTCAVFMRHMLHHNGLDCPALVAAARFHDIGHNIFRHEQPKKFSLVNAGEVEHAQPRTNLERQMLPMTHCQTGSFLLQTWLFPEQVWRPVEYHHPDQIPDNYVTETALLQYVDWIDSQARNIPIEKPLDGLMQAIGLDLTDTEKIVAKHRRWIDWMHKRIAAKQEILTASLQALSKPSADMETPPPHV